MKRIFSALTIVAAGTFALPALATDTMAKSDIDFFYAEIEGGYSYFDGAGVPGTPRSLELDGGGYGTVTLGHVSIDDGIIGGYVDRAEAWFSYFDHGDDSLSFGGDFVSFERDYWEVGTRFQHYFDQSAANKMMWGLEPFYGEFKGDIFNRPNVGAPGTVDIDTSVYGAMLSFEYERAVTPATMLLFRAAGGAYGSNTDVVVSSPLTTASGDTTGFRGQLAFGLKHQVNARTSVGLVGRLDYFSDVAYYDSTSSNLMRNDDLLGISIGANLNYIFAGIYQ